MTGPELATALRRWAELLERSGRVNGLEVEVLTGARLVVVSVDAERMRKKRTQSEHKANKTRTQTEQNTNTGPSVSVFSLDLDPRSVPDLGSVVPDSSPQNLTGSSAKQAESVGKKRAARAVKARPAKWTRVPADWEPKPEHRELAANKNLTFEDELANFRDHEFKDPKTDADAAFRRWLRQPWKGEQKANGRLSPQSGVHAALGFAAEVMAQGAKQ